MNNRVIIGIALISFSGGVFGMDLAPTSEQSEPKQELRERLAAAVNTFEVKILDKNVFDTLTHYDSILTITNGGYDITYRYKGGGGKIPEEENWQYMPISQEHLAEIARKSDIFYLCVYEKGAYAEDHDPACCIRVIQTIIDSNGHSISVQLEDPDKKIVQRMYWNVPSVSSVLCYGFSSLIVLYRLGWLQRCGQFLNGMWSRTTS